MNRKVEFYVAHNPPNLEHGTEILVTDKIRRINREDSNRIAFYVCPHPEGTLSTPQVVNGVPTLFCHPNGFQQLVSKYSPKLISYQHLLRWALSILCVQTDARKELSLHDSSLWCAMWHSFDGKEVCNEPEPDKCARCAGIPAEEIRRKAEEVKKYLPMMDALYANSAYTAKLANKWLLGIDSDENATQSPHDAQEGAKSFFIVNPVSPELPVYRKRKVIGYFGGFYPVKGVGVLLDAMQKVRWGQLLMFCDVPEGFAKGRSLYGHENVLVMGRYDRNDLPKLLNLVDFVVVPSHVESFGLVKRECEALGKKVLATKTGGMDGTIEPGNVEELAEAIQGVIDEDKIN